MAILVRLHGTATEDCGGNYAQSEFDQIKRQLELDNLLPTSWASLFVVPSYRKRAVVGFITMFLGQCTGTQIINSKLNITNGMVADIDQFSSDYGPSLYASMGFDSKNQLLISAGWISVGIVANYFNALLLDRAGRVLLLSKSTLVPLRLA